MLAALLESCGSGSSVSHFPWHVPATATPTLYRHFSCVVSVTTWGHKLHRHVVLVSDHRLHALGHFFVQHVLFGYDPGLVEVGYHRRVCSFYLLAVLALRRGDQDNGAVDFYKYHDVLVSSEQSLRKLPNLVREDSPSDVVDFCVDVSYFLSLQLRCVVFFEGAGGSARAGPAGTSFFEPRLACGIHRLWSGSWWKARSSLFGSSDLSKSRLSPGNIF